MLKELLKYEGRNEANTGSPREIIKAAYTIYDFIDEDVWISMLKSRNDMTHIYNGEAARELVNDILNVYIPDFLKMKNEILLQYGHILKEI